VSDDGAGDTATESACLTCSSDAGVDVSLGRQVALRFDGCNGVESGCHSSNVAGLDFPAGNEFKNLKVLGDGGIDGSQMPLGGPFTASLPILIYDWIEAGAPDP